MGCPLFNDKVNQIVKYMKLTSDEIPISDKDPLYIETEVNFAYLKVQKA
jgi:hypothetical protein